MLFHPVRQSCNLFIDTDIPFIEYYNSLYCSSSKKLPENVTLLEGKRAVSWCRLLPYTCNHDWMRVCNLNNQGPEHNTKNVKFIFLQLQCEAYAERKWEPVTCTCRHKVPLVLHSSVVGQAQKQRVTRDTEGAESSTLVGWNACIYAPSAYFWKYCVILLR